MNTTQYSKQAVGKTDSLVKLIPKDSKGKVYDNHGGGHCGFINTLRNKRNDKKGRK